jgi:hypothetical protein
MISSDPRLKVNVGEQLARSIVASAHASPPKLLGANESQPPVGDEHLFSTACWRAPSFTARTQSRANRQTLNKDHEYSVRLWAVFCGHLLSLPKRVAEWRPIFIPDENSLCMAVRATGHMIHLGRLIGSSSS